MVVERFALGPLQTNCYLVYREGFDECMVIDPGDDPRELIQRIEELGLILRTVLLTHGHFDHVGGVKALKDRYNCYVGMHEGDWTLPMEIGGLGRTSHVLRDNMEIVGSSMGFRVYHTPGHTPGSCCIAGGDRETGYTCIFTGDTLFQGSVGRTDLPGGKAQELVKSISFLANLPGDYIIYPGHGEETTLQYERDNNIFVRNWK